MPAATRNLKHYSQIVGFLSAQIAVVLLSLVDRAHAANTKIKALSILPPERVGVESFIHRNAGSDDSRGNRAAFIFCCGRVRNRHRRKVCSPPSLLEQPTRIAYAFTALTTLPVCSPVCQFTGNFFLLVQDWVLPIVPSAVRAAHSCEWAMLNDYRQERLII